MMLPHKDSRYDTHSLDRYRADKANGYHNNFDPHPPQRVSTVVRSNVVPTLSSPLWYASWKEASVWSLNEARRSKLSDKFVLGPVLLSLTSLLWRTSFWRHGREAYQRAKKHKWRLAPLLGHNVASRRALHHSSQTVSREPWKQGWSALI